MRHKRLRAWVLRPLLLALVPVLGVLAWNHSTGNFGAVTPGEVYRSGQMDGGMLGRTVREHGIKTVLNLRGHHPEEGWYRAERDASVGAGATQIDMALSSCEWMSRAQAKALLDLLDRAEKPILVHCFHGSERTGLISAYSKLIRPGSTLADARGQFTLKHLYVPFGDGIVMARHLDRYESWLAALGQPHTPELFRRWIAEGYTPGSPSREQWPFDPYPLKVVTHPPARPGEPMKAETEWTPGSEPGGANRTAGAEPAPSTHPESTRR